MTMEVDWVAILDTDEYFHFKTRNTSVNTLKNFLVIWPTLSNDGGKPPTELG